MTSSGTPIDDEEIARLLSLATKKNVSKQFATDLIAKLPQASRTQSLSNMGRLIESSVAVFGYKVDQTHSEALSARHEFIKTETPRKKQKENKSDESSSKKSRALFDYEASGSGIKDTDLFQLHDKGVEDLDSMLSSISQTKKFQLPNEDFNVEMDDKEPFNPLYSKTIRRTGVTPGALMLVNAATSESGLEMRLHPRPFGQRRENATSIIEEEELSTNEGLLELMGKHNFENRSNFTEDFQDFDSMWHCEVSAELQEAVDSNKRITRRGKKTFETVYVLTKGSIEEPLYIGQNMSNTMRGHAWTMPDRLPLQPFHLAHIPKITEADFNLDVLTKSRRVNADLDLAAAVDFLEHVFGSTELIREDEDYWEQSSNHISDDVCPDTCLGTLQSIVAVDVAADVSIVDVPNASVHISDVSSSNTSARIIDVPNTSARISDVSSSNTSARIVDVPNTSARISDFPNTPARNMADDSHWKTIRGSDPGKTPGTLGRPRKKPVAVDSRLEMLTMDDVETSLEQRAERHKAIKKSSDVIGDCVQDHVGDREHFDADLCDQLNNFSIRYTCVESVVPHKPVRMLEKMILEDLLRQKEVYGCEQIEGCCKSLDRLSITSSEITYEELLRMHHKDNRSVNGSGRPKIFNTPKKLRGRTRTPLRPVLDSVLEDPLEAEYQAAAGGSPVHPTLDGEGDDYLCEALQANNHDIESSTTGLGEDYNHQNEDVEPISADEVTNAVYSNDKTGGTVDDALNQMAFDTESQTHSQRAWTQAKYDEEECEMLIGCKFKQSRVDAALVKRAIKTILSDSKQAIDQNISVEVAIGIVQDALSQGVSTQQGQKMEEPEHDEQTNEYKKLNVRMGDFTVDGHHTFTNMLARLGPYVDPQTAEDLKSATAMTILLHMCNENVLNLNQERCPIRGVVKESALNDFDINSMTSDN